MRIRVHRLVMAMAALLALSACGWQRVVEEEKAAGAAWAELIARYDARDEVLLELLNFTSKYPKVFAENAALVEKGWAKVRELALGAETLPESFKFAPFDLAQDSLSRALVKLWQDAQAFTEDDDAWRASFDALWARLTAADEAVHAARERYREAVIRYNTVVLRFPTSIGASLRGKDLVAAPAASPPRLSKAAEAEISEDPKLERQQRQNPFAREPL